MQTADYIVFIVYLAGVTLFGMTFFRKSKTASQFTLGNQSIPGWVVMMSIFATYVSSISYLALPGSSFMSDWNAFVFSLSIPLAALVAVKFFVPLYRKINSPSAYTYLEQRFGPWARIYASASYFLTQLMRIGTILYLLSLTVHTIFGWDIRLVIIITGLIVMVYSTLGGIQAVVWTDAIQGLVLIAGAVVAVIVILTGMPEGPGQVFRIAAENNKFSLGSFSAGLSEQTFWVVLVYGLFINLQNFGIDQNYVQRYIAARTDTEAGKAAFRGGMLYIPVSLLFLFIGTALFAFYHSGAAELPAQLTSQGRGDGVFPYFIVNQLPVGLTGLLISSIFAAGMSTISTSYNSSATVFLTDYYQRFFSKTVSEREAMRVLYISSLVISLCGIVIAIAMINVRSVLDTWWKLASVFSGGMLGLFLLGITTKRKNTAGAIIGVIIGISIIMWMSLSGIRSGSMGEIPRFHTYLTIVFGTSAIFLTGFLFTIIMKNNNSNLKKNG
ncbi:MAG: sodium:solute symporter [Bacteroidales bacterium]|jgi:SSS family solute:Na+ symporter|nr:sodium:solute symporter [Bacteroidales bacterium]